MGAEDNGLSLEGLAKRLETLERENAALRHKVATLESLETRWTEGEATTQLDGRVSRRALLSKAGAAAVAALAAGTLLNPRQAKANHYNPGIQVNSVDTHRVQAIQEANNYAVSGLNNSNFGAVEGFNNGSGPGVYGNNFNLRGPGVKGVGVIGVRGKSSTDGQAGVYGEHPFSVGPGVVGRRDGR
jgi:hypothetical protein